MYVRLSKYTHGRDNNFNLIRFIAAILVLFSHSAVIVTGDHSLEPLFNKLGFSLGYISVDVFFISSGFLITASLLQRNDLISFAWARILRIYPGLIVATLLTIVLLGLFSSLGWGEYLKNEDTQLFLHKNTVIFFGVHYQLPDVFNGLALPDIVNGSLWTLPWELRMYCLIGFIGGLCFYTARFQSVQLPKIILYIALISTTALYAYRVIFGEIPLNFEASALRFTSLFFIGATFYVFKERIVMSTKLAVVAAVILFVCSFNKVIFFFSYMIFLPYLVLYLAYVPKGFIRHFNKLGDYSYGMYVYAMPVQQALVALVPSIGIAALSIQAFIITLIFSLFSWYYVEKPALALKNIVHSKKPAAQV